MSTERHIEIETPKGTFKVWTCRVGEHPTKKLLILHGGPGASHEGFEIFEQYLPRDGYLLGQSWGVVSSTRWTTFAERWDELELPSFDRPQASH
jgi:hypothetical protein